MKNMDEFKKGFLLTGAVGSGIGGIVGLILALYTGSWPMSIVGLVTGGLIGDIIYFIFKDNLKRKIIVSHKIINVIFAVICLGLAICGLILTIYKRDFRGLVILSTFGLAFLYLVNMVRGK